MGTLRTYARNALSNWMYYAVSMGVMFFMTPYVAHSLGKSGYGIWSIVITLVGYLGLAELGTRVSLGRFINYYMGRGETDKVNGCINTAQVFFLFCGVILFAAAGVLAWAFPMLFPKASGPMVVQARVALIVMPLGLLMSFLMAGFNQVFIASDRFDVQNGVSLAALVVQTVGALLVLNRHVGWGGVVPRDLGGGVLFATTGLGIVGLSVVHVGSGLLRLVLAMTLAHRIWPPLRVRLSLASLRQFRELFNFSIWAFLGNIGSQLLHWTDTMVIGMVFGSELVAVYAIGSMLLIRVQGFVGQGLSPLFPQMVKACARDDWATLRSLFYRGNIVLMALSIPILTGLIVFGREFILQWMGEGYRLSYVILVILAISKYFGFLSAMCPSICSGMNRPQFTTLIVLGQGVTNLGCTLLFILPLGMGIEGVALGTLVPRIVFSLILLVVVMRWIGLSPRTFLMVSLWRWGVGIGGFLVIGYALNRLVPPDGWLHFFVKVALSLVLYLPLAWWTVLRGEERRQVLDRVRQQAAFLRGKRPILPAGAAKKSDE